MINLPDSESDSKRKNPVMCTTCGCSVTNETETNTIRVMENLLARNDSLAAHNRQHFNEAGVLVINLMSAPGSGKTSLLEATIRAVAGRWRIAVIEGDLETENDAERIRRQGVAAVQITTGMACHLDAAMVHGVLDALPLGQIDVLFIENVGNLVCPASFDLGQHVNVVLLSVAEGDDKPEKYPVMFRLADQVLISKVDLLPYLGDFDPDRARRSIGALSASTAVTLVSAKSGLGLRDWITWIDQQIDARNRINLPITGEHSHHHHAV
ncbi:MAG: hydrogenase nickel incorporation protein HypB [Azospirillaceae bacterium]|nr:hydrogenase nickel incorporation protein HypB [Azospirillaceae bacterium]